MRNIAAIITVIFSVLLILIVWFAIIMQSDKKISLNEIFMQKEISVKDLPPVVDRQVNLQDSSTNKPVTKELPEKEKIKPQKEEYFIIIGSFRDQMVAKKKADELRKASRREVILLPPTKEGFYRISAGRYPTHEMARTKLDSVRSTIKSDAWIFSAVN